MRTFDADFGQTNVKRVLYVHVVGDIGSDIQVGLTPDAGTEYVYPTELVPVPGVQTSPGGGRPGNAWHLLLGRLDQQRWAAVRNSPPRSADRHHLEAQVNIHKVLIGEGAERFLPFALAKLRHFKAWAKHPIVQQYPIEDGRILIEYNPIANQHFVRIEQGGATLGYEFFTTHDYVTAFPVAWWATEVSPQPDGADIGAAGPATLHRLHRGSRAGGTAGSSGPGAQWSAQCGIPLVARSGGGAGDGSDSDEALLRDVDLRVLFLAGAGHGLSELHGELHHNRRDERRTSRPT